jgi:hypothetical protein
MSRWCDQSIHDPGTLRQTQWPLTRSRVCLELGSRKPSWPAFMCERNTGRTYGRNDLIKALQNTLRGGGRPHVGLDRGPHLGQRSSWSVDKAGHMIAFDPPVRFLIFSLASKGPSTHAPTPIKPGPDRPHGIETCYDGHAPRAAKSNSHGPLTMLSQRSMKEEVYREHTREMNVAYASRVNPKVGIAE